MKLRLLLAGVLGAAAFVSSVGAATTAGQLVGTTGPGFTITLKMNGKSVKTLTHGTYKLVVHDKSSLHNFHNLGPVRGHKDRHGDAEEGQVHVPVRHPCRQRHEAQLHRHLRRIKRRPSPSGAPHGPRRTDAITSYAGRKASIEGPTG
jgi:hypothetical protein